MAWVSSGCRSGAQTSELDEHEGEPEGCYKALVWVIEASAKVEVWTRDYRRDHQGRCQRDEADMIGMYACLSD